MELLARIQLFATELNFIQSPIIRSFAEFCLGNLPEYFFHVPASSSGKYHPAYTQGEGGLVRHTKAAMRIFKFFTLCEADRYYIQESILTDPIEFDDACFLALLLHDGLKHGAAQTVAVAGQESHTIHEHPLLASTFITEQVRAYLNTRSLENADATILWYASRLVESHMGKWTVSKYSSAILPSPANADWGAKLVHMADYLASRKSIEFNFDAQM